jgi:N-glycosidase YbiA
MLSKIFFYRTNEPFGSFSNFSDHPVLLDGTYWKTVEHYFQASKFLNDHCMKIQMSESPMGAALLGRSRDFPIRSDWESVKDSIMRKAVFKKIEMYHDVKSLLLSTEDAILVERTENDNYWGDGGDGKGLNKLGLILMEARDLCNLNYNELEVMLPPWCKYPGVMPYDMSWSMGDSGDYLMSWALWFENLSLDSKKKYKNENQSPDYWPLFYQDLIK